MYDIIIVGAGPAGLTAAIYARRASKKTLVLEAATYGGQIINTLDIENYPGEEKISGIELAKKLYTQAKNLGAEFEYEKVTRIADNGESKLVKTEESEYEAKAVIIATGTENRKLGLENEEKFTGRGISYCATCDGALFKDKTVAVAGGGSGALYEAQYLSDIVGKLYLIHRRDEFRGEDALVQDLKNRNNVEFILKSNVEALIGDDKLERILVKSADGEEKELDVDGLFIAVGRMPSNEAFKDLINTDEAGYVEASEDCKTNVEGVFVAGDNRTKAVRQIVTATSDGAIAASAAVHYINGGYYAAN
jgi:thioredoxin reductase (NADPH)